MADCSTACAIAGATARHRSCSSRTTSSHGWSPSSRPPARTRSAITACSPPALAGAIGWSRRGLSRTDPRGRHAAATLPAGRPARAREGEWASVPRTTVRRRHQPPPGAAAHRAATPGRTSYAVCSQWTSWSVQIAAGGCGSSPRSKRPMPPAPFSSVSACRRAPRPPSPPDPSPTLRSPRPTGRPPGQGWNPTAGMPREGRRVYTHSHAPPVAASTPTGSSPTALRNPVPPHSATHRQSSS